MCPTVQVLIYRNDGFESSGGTSAASPITAGLLALVNDAPLRSGRPPLGFVAPWLYKIAVSSPAAFNDVVIGNNKNGELQECPYGFSAAKVCALPARWRACRIVVWKADAPNAAASRVRCASRAGTL